MYVKEQLLFISKPVYTGIYIYMYLLNVESLLKSSKYALEWVQVYRVYYKQVRTAIISKFVIARTVIFLSKTIYVVKMF